MSDNAHQHGFEALPQKRARAVEGGRADAAPRFFRADGGGTYASCLGIILTEACNIRCSHCLPECEPRRTENLQWAALDRILRDAKRAGSVTKVAFTGGEPFLVPTVLRQAVALCAELRLGSSVMTNGFWASSVLRAREALQRLPGLTELGLSTDTFHQDFIPVERIRNAITAGQELGIRCIVRVCVLSHPEEAAERTREQLAGLDKWYTLQIQPIQPMGRAVGLKADCTVTDLTTWLGCNGANSPSGDHVRRRHGVLWSLKPMARPSSTLPWKRLRAFGGSRSTRWRRKPDHSRNPASGSLVASGSRPETGRSRGDEPASPAVRFHLFGM